MPTKLKGLKIKRVALVDEGANPDAHVKFAKSKDGNEPIDDGRVTTEEAASFLQRLASALNKAFLGEQVEKTAFTFAQTEDKRNYEKVMSDEVYPMIWAFTDSICSIMNDPDKSDDEKSSLMKQSVSEFSETFGSCAGDWSQAKPAKSSVAKDDEVLTKMRDTLNDLIEKKAGCGGKKPMKKEDDPDDMDDDPDDDSDDEPDDDDDANKGCNPKNRMKKGATDMEFDVSKMTPEEKAQFDDLAKRFGISGNPAPAQPTATNPPAANPVNDDVVKGMQAELEELRKFRQAAEERELAEVAKRYAIIGKKPEELIPVLKSLKAVGDDAFNQFVAGLDSAVQAVEKSGTFAEIGKRGDPGSSADAWGKIEAAAHEIMKSKPDMRWPDAVDAACAAHPDLVDEYEKSRK